jgi:hypothetical protein
MAIAGIAAALTVWVLGPHSLTSADADRVKEGMDLAEVEKTLGQPPELIEELGPRAAVKGNSHWSPPPESIGKPVRVATWESRRVLIIVVFVEGRAKSATAIEKERDPLWMQLRDWITTLG